MSTTRPIRVFITHSWRDIDFARKLHKDLQSQGLELWFDASTLQAGQRLMEEINRGLAWCDIYIPIISRAALKSPACMEEINIALTLSIQPGRNNRPRIIPVLIEDCRNELPPSLAARLYVSFYRRAYADALKELLQKGFGVTANLGATSTDEPIPEIEKNYQAGIHALVMGQFDDAVMSLRRVVDEDRNYKNAALKLDEAERLRRRALPVPATRPVLRAPYAPSIAALLSILILAVVIISMFSASIIVIVAVHPNTTTTPTLQVALTTPTSREALPSLERIAFSVSHGDRPDDKSIWIMLADGSDLKKILDRASEPAFSPDGSKIAYYRWTDGIFVASADGTNPKKILGETSSGFLSWSHDGRWIAFTVRPSGSGNISTDVIAPDGSGRRPVVVGWSPSWSPDDTQLVFQTCRGSQCGIYKAPSAGGDAVPIVTDGGELPTWSPDGKQILYQDRVDGQLQLFLVNSDGSGKRQLTFGSVPHLEAAWSPRGDFIFYRSPEGGGWGIWKMTADGMNAEKLLDNVPPVDQSGERLAVTY